jgi:hypothetical protein
MSVLFCLNRFNGLLTHALQITLQKGLSHLFKSKQPRLQLRLINCVNVSLGWIPARNLKVSNDGPNDNYYPPFSKDKVFNDHEARSYVERYYPNVLNYENQNQYGGQYGGQYDNQYGSQVAMLYNKFFVTDGANK